MIVVFKHWFDFCQKKKKYWFDYPKRLN